MHMSILAKITTCVLLLSASAADSALADFKWILIAEAGNIELVALDAEPDDDTADYTFRARCLKGGNIEFGVGADQELRKKIGSSGEVTLVSKTVTAKIKGTFRKSPNWENTNKIELRERVRLSIPMSHPLFSVLRTGFPVSVRGSIATSTWPVDGLTDKVTEFLERCSD